MTMAIREQLKTGKTITLLQLSISMIGLLACAVGLYVASEVSKAHLQDRVDALEKTIAQQQATAQINRSKRDVELKELDERIDQNTNDINIIRTQLQYLKK